MPEVFAKIAVGLAVVLFFFLVVIRGARRLVQFPIPAFLTRVIDNPVRRLIQPPAQVVEWIGIRDGMQVLEIGPGSGTFTIEAARRVGRGKVHAVDIQPAVILRLRRRLEREKIESVSAQVESAYELPFADQTFDRVFMITVLGEIPDKKRALVEIRRVLKDEGLLAIGEFLPDPDYPLRRTVVRWCADAGFEPVKEQGGFLHYLLTFKARAGDASANT